MLFQFPEPWDRYLPLWYSGLPKWDTPVAVAVLLDKGLCRADTPVAVLLDKGLRRADTPVVVAVPLNKGLRRADTPVPVHKGSPAKATGLAPADTVPID